MQGNSLLGADGLQRCVDVRQMIQRDVADAGVDDLVGAHAAVQPAEEQDELDGHGQERGEPAGGGCLG
jgi:hypothetical protein